MTDLNVAVSRGLRAKAILDDELFKEAFTKLEQDYIAAWRVCIDPRKRGVLWVYVNALGKVRDHLSRVIADGKLAQVQQKYIREGIIPNGS